MIFFNYFSSFFTCLLARLLDCCGQNAHCIKTNISNKLDDVNSYMWQTTTNFWLKHIPLVLPIHSCTQHYITVRSTNSNNKMSTLLKHIKISTPLKHALNYYIYCYLFFTIFLDWFSPLAWTSSSFLIFLIFIKKIIFLWIFLHVLSPWHPITSTSSSSLFKFEIWLLPFYMVSYAVY